ncbi:hypothetical protein [Acinetobacter sp. ANC 3813]|uniref:hypothetical protein n=1 Tax=Acinetobacter sp. ANC 3813 TaxID=1977873 RepID=UPI00148A78A1|nr:hypothetical protein [Acinetobacter sp. ANC 3813]
MKKVLMMLSIAACLTAAMNVQADANTAPESSSQEVAPCTNGFDSVNVCQLLS